MNRHNCLESTKLLIIDMDNTLCDTYHSLSLRQWHAVADAFERKGEHNIAAGLRQRLGKKGFVAAMRELQFTPAQMRFAMSIYDRAKVNNLKMYDDAGALLQLNIPKVLVSRGNRNLQLEKIRHLQLRPYFSKIHLVPTLQRKGDAFSKILAQYHLKPSQALVIGDRIEDEIADGHKLGIPTCLIRRPDWKPGTGTTPTITVHSLRTLAKRLKM